MTRFPAGTGRWLLTADRNTTANYSPRNHTKPLANQFTRTVSTHATPKSLVSGCPKHGQLLMLQTLQARSCDHASGSGRDPKSSPCRRAGEARMSCGPAVSDGHRTACMRCGLISGPAGETRRLSGMRRVPLEPDLCTAQQ